MKIAARRGGTKYLSGTGLPYMEKEEQVNLPMFTKFVFTADEINLEANTVNASGDTVLYDSYTIEKGD